RAASGAYRVDQPRQAALDVIGAETMNERETAGFAGGVEDLDQAADVIGAHLRADLHGDGIGDAAEVFNVRAIGIGGAHAYPREMRRQVVPAPRFRHEMRLRLLVEQVQSLV